MIIAILGLVLMGVILGMNCRKSHHCNDNEWFYYPESYEKERAERYAKENDRLLYENLKLQQEICRGSCRLQGMYFPYKCPECHHNLIK